MWNRARFTAGDSLRQRRSPISRRRMLAGEPCVFGDHGLRMARGHMDVHFVLHGLEHLRMNDLQIVGRRSSHFTRMPLLFADELGVAVQVVPVYDMTAMAPEAYAGNPALKLPILRQGDTVLFGAQNICRALAERASHSARIVWPEEMRDALSRNAQELVWHSMAAQVQLVLGTSVCKLPADNGYFTKARVGFEGALAWLDAHLEQALAALPAQCDLSMLEVSLFCLLDHLAFRPTVSLQGYSVLRRFTEAFAARPAAQRTVYQFDAPPVGD
jgi:glutathione S-transferase